MRRKKWFKSKRRSSFSKTNKVVEEEEEEEEKKELFVKGKKKVLNLTGGYVDCGKFLFWKSGQKGLSVSAWVKPYQKSDFMVISQGGGWNTKGWQIWRFNNSNIRVELNSKRGKKILDNSEDIKEKEWQHVGFTYDGKLLTTYYNGKALSQTCKWDVGDFPSMSQCGNLQFARNVTHGYGMNGKLSEIKIWNCGLSKKQWEDEMFTVHKKDSKKSDSLIGYWPLEDNLVNQGSRKTGNGIMKGSKFQNTFKVVEDVPLRFKPFSIEYFEEHKAYNTLSTLFHDSKFSDFTLKVLEKNGEHKEFKVHKNILGCESKEMKKLILDAESGVAEIKHFGAKLVEQVLNYIYVGRCEITADNFSLLIKFSDRYGLGSLRKRAFKYMVKSLDETTVIPIMFKAKNKEFDFDSSDLVGQCLKILESKIEKVLGSQLYSLDEELMLGLLKSSGLNIDEVDLYNHVIRWGTHQKKVKGEERSVKQIVQNLMNWIRFPLFSVDELLDAKKDNYISDERYLLCCENVVNPKFFAKRPDLIFQCRAKLFKKSILLTTKYSSILAKWLKLPSTCKGFSRVYQASKDGWATTTFHAKSDGKGPSIVVIKSGNGNIFGGWNPHGWTAGSGYNNTGGSWIFSLTNALGPHKMDWMPGKSGPYSSGSYGPTFGGGHDLYLCNNPNVTRSSYSNLGHSYKPPLNYTYGSTSAKNFLAGSYNYLVTEIEVFAMIK